MNGDKLGQETPNARDLTREINAETDLVVEAQDEREQAADRPIEQVELQNDLRAAGVEYRQAVNLGNKILTYNPEQVAREERQMGRENARVREMVATENGETVDGDESARLVREREAWNKENFLNELDPKRDHEAQIMAHDQMGIGREMAGMVEKATKTENFRIMDLVLMQSKGRDRMLESFENPRRLGDMN